VARKLTEEEDRNWGPMLVQAFKDLSAADKSVIIEATRKPGAVIMTTKGSPNDNFCEMAEVVRWTAPAPLPEGLPKGPFAAWTVTSLGGLSLPLLFRKAMPN